VEKTSSPQQTRREEPVAPPNKRAAGSDLGSDRRGFAALARDWGAIAAISWLSLRSESIAVYIAAVWLIGAFQFAIGESLIHEASHYHLFRTRAWNDRFEFLYALPFFMTVAQFRQEHLAHHRDVGTSRDELLADYRLVGLLEPRIHAFWLWFVKPLTGFAGWFYWTKLSLKPSKCGVKIVAFWALVAAVAAYFGALRLVALYWLVPMWWCHTSYLYWSEIQDHFATVSGTRSVVGGLSNGLWHNNGFHAVHHSRPAVPWYRLREAHREFVAAGKHPEQDISSGFLETYRQLRAASN
jgi:fatty acid desaturase